ncbi:M50 family metallopeptidase [Nonomuraea sp. NEAU-A123]|uniref:M50 family metallopeptidase n=1 Tax=Nonomuraea sp. NEAU-A123 TaxID=2839649 RepID=UPI001BE47413|nr:M50 family metallopeptidase [Nonomuraea sp. NEAU-A123]MBT2230439.1 M50 family metallopeptidase [Nonomuraea sp. NEAU-A123]
MDKLWAHLIEVQPAPDPWVVVVSALVALAIVSFGMSWQLSRGLITIAHEGGHALMALVTRRKLEGIRLHSDTSGVTLTRGRPNGPGMVLTALAGYLAPSILGLAAAWLTEQGRITLLMWTVLLFLVCMLLLIRNLYGALILLATGGAVFALSMYAPDNVQQVVALVAVWFLLFGGVRPIIELQRKRRRRQARDSDADQLARLTILPGGFYVFFFLLVAGASVVGGAYLMNPL